MAQTWAHVQSRAATGGGSGTTQALAFTGNTTTGNTIVIATHTNNVARNIASITDSQGNTYVQTQAAQTRTSHGAADIWYAKNITGGTTPTVTVTFSGSLSGVDTYTAIHEYSGLNTTAPLDQVAAANGSGLSPSSGNTPATTAADDLVFGFCYAGGTASAGAGFTSRQTVNGDQTEDKNQATTAAVAATFTQTSSSGDPYVAMCATFKQAAGGTDGTATSPAATGLGDFPAPAFQAGATVTTPAADALGDFPDSQMLIGSDVTAPAALVFGDFPVPTVTGTGDSTVTAPAATGLGDFPAPATQWGNTVTVPARTALGDFPVPTVTGTVSATVTAVPADATGDFPVPTISDGSAGTITPHYDTPTTFDLDAHDTTSELTAHTNTFELTAHDNTSTLTALVPEFALDA